MSIQKPIQHYILEFLSKHKKKVFTFIFVILSFFILLSVRNNYIIASNIDFTEHIFQIKDKLNNKKMDEAMVILFALELKNKKARFFAKLEQKLSLGYSNKQYMLNKNKALLLLLLRIKIETIGKNGLQIKTKKKIKNLSYISQCTSYKEFSMFGEWLLMYKMYLHLIDKEYNECDTMLLDYNLQKLPHQFARYQRAIALLKIDKSKAKDILKFEITNGQTSTLLNQLLHIGVSSDKK